MIQNLQRSVIPHCGCGGFGEDLLYRFLISWFWELPAESLSGVVESEYLVSGIGRFFESYHCKDSRESDPDGQPRFSSGDGLLESHYEIGVMEPPSLRHSQTRYRCPVDGACQVGEMDHVVAAVEHDFRSFWHDNFLSDPHAAEPWSSEDLSK